MRTMHEVGGITKIPDGLWYIRCDDIRYDGYIKSSNMTVNCLIDIWTLICHDKKVGSAQFEITAPRTRFRKVKGNTEEAVLCPSCKMRMLMHTEPTRGYCYACEWVSREGEN